MPYRKNLYTQSVHIANVCIKHFFLLSLVVYRFPCGVTTNVHRYEFRKTGLDALSMHIKLRPSLDWPEV